MTRSRGSASTSKPRKDVGSAGRSTNRRDARALPPRGDGRKESRSRKFWRRWRSIFWLGFIGLILSGLSYFTYPSRDTIVGSSYTSVSVKATKAVDLVGFASQQAARGATRLEIGVLADHSVPRDTTVSVEVVLPDGFFFSRCPRPECFQIRQGAVWHSEVHLTQRNSVSSGILRLTIRASGFGYASNGLNAVVALPQLFYKGPGTPVLEASYPIKSAGSYNWSEPPANIGSRRADWTETALNGDVAPQNIDGLDSSAQARDNFTLFVSGALVALGGAALLWRVPGISSHEEQDFTRQERRLIWTPRVYAYMFPSQFPEADQFR